MPAGLSKDGIPLGLQLIGKAFDEVTLFRSAQAIEDAAGILTAPEAWWASGSTSAGKAGAKRVGKAKSKA